MNPQGTRTRSVGTALVLGLAVVLSGAGVDAAPPLRGSDNERTLAAAKNAQEPVMNPTAEKRHTNRLIKATSPYLLQHAHNPVDWYEWGEAALRRAGDEQKPIFLSIGYAACHWCHVMEHESFEDEAVAGVLNESFVSIKVDREERPDLDELYMAYTQALTKHGGWPMSVWLTPDGTPFYAGTYFPKEQFVQVLTSIAGAWTDERERITKGASAAQEFFAQWAAPSPPGEALIPREVVDSAAATLANHFDRARGGISGGGSNKFPPSLALDLMLRVHRRTGKSDLFDAVKVTLDNMARGGIYDHIGGGLCRYSTDVEWLVPHFEKMLYDQALVAGIYLDAFQASRDPWYAAVASDILDYVLADLRSPEGAFYSSRDADSEGLEGKFYIWTVDEVQRILGEEEGRLFCAFYDVTETGNWFERLGHAPKGAKNILHITKPPEAFAKLHQIEVDELQRRIGAWREKMRAARARRTPPALDDKVLTGWNGLMIAGLAKAARVLEKPAYAEAAAKAAEFMLTKMRREGRLLATYRNGEARLTAYLSDYAFLIEGLLNLHEATFDRRWLDAAVALTETSIRFYYDEQGGGFFFTASDGEKLLARSKQPQDGAIPAGNSVHAMNLLRLSVLLDRKDFREKAESILRAFGDEVQRAPYSYERLLCAADFLHDSVKEIVLIGDPVAAETQALVRTVYQRYLPNKVVLHAADAVPGTDMLLLKGKTRMQGKSTAYVCEKGNCKQPVTAPEALGKQLDAK